MLLYQGTCSQEIITALVTMRIGQLSGCLLNQFRRHILKRLTYGHLVYFYGSWWQKHSNPFPMLIRSRWNHIWMKGIACINQWIVLTNYILCWQHVGVQDLMSEQACNPCIQPFSLYKSSYSSLFNYLFLFDKCLLTIVPIDLNSWYFCDIPRLIITLPK